MPVAMSQSQNREPPSATLPPTLGDIDALAQAAIERLPDEFRDWLGPVLLRVEDFPDAEVMAAMALESEFDILGVYQGRHVGLKGDVPTGALPDIIFLYRRALLDEWCETGESLDALVTNTIVHEIGHHFGLSDADMARIEAAAE